MQAVKILMVSRYDMLAGGVEGLALQNPQYQVQTCCHSPADGTIVDAVSETILNYHPMVVIIDETGFSLKTVFELTALLKNPRQHAEDVKLVLMSSTITHAKVAMALEQGFRGIFCLEDRLKSRFSNLISRLFTERLVMTTTASDIYFSYQEAQLLFANLNDTQKLILMMMHEEYPAADIATALSCTPQNIYVHTMRLRATFDVSNNDELLDKVRNLLESSV